MLDSNLIQSTSSWPFVEIRKLLKDRKDLIADKKKSNFSNPVMVQVGYLISAHLVKWQELQ